MSSSVSAFGVAFGLGLSESAFGVSLWVLAFGVGLRCRPSASAFGVGVGVGLPSDRARAWDRAAPFHRGIRYTALLAAIWRETTTTWELLPTTGFPDEAALHQLVERAPRLLPLAGAPDLVVIGREVQLGTGYADLLAVEREGRLVVIEVKLAKNAEARRAVISQVLAYASYLHGTDLETLEADVLKKHLRPRGFATLADAAASNDQSASFDPQAFSDNLQRNLREGRFRLVIVLDSAPADLVRLAGYLETIADKLVIDLVTVSAYEVGGTRIMVPQRVDAERRAEDAPARPSSPSKGVLTDGAEVFEAAIENAKPEERANLRKIVAWARALEKEGIVELTSFAGKAERWILLPRLQPDNAGLVSIWNDGRIQIGFWRSVFQKWAPDFIAPVEAKTGVAMGQGTSIRGVDEELLGLLAAAYRAAAGAARGARQAL